MAFPDLRAAVLRVARVPNLLVACDYDGTLAHDGKVDEPTVAALRRFRASGRKLVMVTGRHSVRSLEPVLGELLGILGKAAWILALMLDPRRTMAIRPGKCIHSLPADQVGIRE